MEVEEQQKKQDSSCGIAIIQCTVFYHSSLFFLPLDLPLLCIILTTNQKQRVRRPGNKASLFPIYKLQKTGWDLESKAITMIWPKRGLRQKPKFFAMHGSLCSFVAKCSDELLSSLRFCTELRRAVRSSMVQPSSTSHEHTFPPDKEIYDPSSDTWTKTCVDCGYQVTFEKM